MDMQMRIRGYTCLLWRFWLNPIYLSIHLFALSHRFPNVRLVSADYTKVQTPEYQQHRRPLSYRKWMAEIENTK